MGVLIMPPGTALLLYDWVITLYEEKALVWSRKINLAGVLYVLGRLVGPSSNLASLVLFNNVSDKVSITLSLSAPSWASNADARRRRRYSLLGWPSAHLNEPLPV